LSAGRAAAGLNMDGFWRHSLCVGVAAKIIAKKRGIDPKFVEEYFTAGLLHDIGKISLNAVLASDYMLTISDSDRDRISIVRAEDRKLGIDHTSAGKLIVKSWKLEGPVGDVISFHHNHVDYDGPDKDLLYSIILANRFANIMEIGFSGDRYPEKPGPSIWEFLGLEETLFEEIEPQVNSEIEKAKIFLKL
jgi:putative nucleotidyltransferase with HDIG domain